MMQVFVTVIVNNNYIVIVVVVAPSSIGDGGSGAFLRNCAQTEPAPYTTFPFYGNLKKNITLDILP